MSLDLVEQWTERIVYQLSADGAVVDLTGTTVVLQAYTRQGLLATLTGTSGVVSGSETQGKVFFDPGVNDLLNENSPYAIRWKVTDGAGKVALFPSGPVERWNIRKP